MLEDGVHAMADAYSMSYGTEYYGSPAWSFDTPSPPDHHTPAVGPYGCPRPPIVKRRTSANKKERRRTLSINNAFAELRECIPNVPADTKLSKIKTLRLATSYIAYLMDLLAQDDPTSSGGGGFKAEICKKFESRDERRRKEMVSSSLFFDLGEHEHYPMDVARCL
ncbi:HAND2 [Cordylochernes scorpioides]|uniref:HAND2 n=1 Tax=Cordylochernes scorpioides TaxID=51811 RepID=A0ABY6KP20_9ARAC|nr:HAND2 [Cordylochernes scorpioides]